MKVIELLKKAGTKAGLITVLEETQKEEPAAIQTKNVSLEQLLKEFDVEQKENLTPVAAELFVDLSKVFEALKIPSYEHGWNTDRAAQLLASDSFRSLDRNAAKEALLKILGENKVPPEDIIMDAVNRDKALDSYEEFAHKKLQERTSSRQREMMDLEDEIQQCRERVAILKAAHLEDEQAFEKWLKKKVGMEEELLKIVSLIADDQVISVGNANNQNKKVK